MQLYNTLAKKIEEFKPLKKGQVLMYHCGPTVYWIQHIGNMRAMVMADLVRRTLKYLAYKVKLVRNYTDVGHLSSDQDEGEDKMDKAARRERTTPEKIADKYIKIFEHDIYALNVPDADKKPRATKCINEMIKMVQALLDKGYAYRTDLAVYFDTSKAKNYTELSGQNLADKLKGAGKAEVEDINKKHPSDFAIWFFKAGQHKNALQYWPSPFKSPLVKNGQGFPGWHLECSVMAKKYLADTIDIHMGGIEHVPVHHTNEIAQSESANGVKFANYWLHNEHLLVNNKKMAKSAGTSYSLQEVIAKGFNPVALRYFFLQAHYRSKQNFTWPALKAAQNALEKLYDFLRYPTDDRRQTTDDKRQTTNDRRQTKASKNKFVGFISDDFNIPKALALVWEVAKSDLVFKEKKKLLLDFDKVLGLNLNKIKVEKIKIPAQVKKLVQEREKARQEKNFSKADEIRNKIYDLDFRIEDTENRSIIKKK